MNYKITKYTRDRAKDLGVKVKKSTNSKKKIDVFNRDGNKIASIGAVGYGDYPTYINNMGIEYAEKRKLLYSLRHKKDSSSGNGYWAKNLLW